MREILAPCLRAGQRSSLWTTYLCTQEQMGKRAHRGAEGCQLWLLPSYSPDMNPIEQAFSKVKNLLRKAKARTLEALFALTGRALRAVSKEDARGFFEACDYKTPQDHSL